MIQHSKRNQSRKEHGMNFAANLKSWSVASSVALHDLSLLRDRTSQMQGTTVYYLDLVRFHLFFFGASCVIHSSHIT